MVKKPTIKLADQEYAPVAQTEETIELVVFKTENTNVVLAGVTVSKWEKGWKHSTAEFFRGGVLFTIPGFDLELVPMHAIRQIRFTK